MPLQKLYVGYRTLVTSSGLSAITAVLSALLAKGDHLLIVEDAYGPTKSFCDNELKKFGVEIEYFTSDIAADDFAKLVKENTKLIFLESPGSINFKIQNIEAITNIAHSNNIITAIDNTWSAGIYLNSAAHNIDISIQSCSKYICGHSDIILGSITVNNSAHYQIMHDYIFRSGLRASPHDCYLALRGIRTLAVRLAQHQQSALKIVEWLKEQKQIVKIIYPPAVEDAQHALWQKYFTGGNGLLAIEFAKEYGKEQLVNLIDNLQIFKLGYSWGGYESLVMLYENSSPNSADYMLRLHVGLEDVDDIIADLAQAFERCS